VTLVVVSALPFLLSPWWGTPTMDSFRPFVIFGALIAGAVMGTWENDKPDQGEASLTLNGKDIDEGSSAS
jgi:hypothetical protein